MTAHCELGKQNGISFSARALMRGNPGKRTATAQLPTPNRPTLRTRSRHLRRHRPSPKRSLPAGV